jgi:hypothetical protein
LCIKGTTSVVPFLLVASLIFIFKQERLMPIYIGNITSGRRAMTVAATGSTWFGNSSGDTHNFYGDMYLTGNMVVNQSGGDVDFRVEGENDTHLFFVDGSTDAVSIGVSADAPSALLEITGDSAQAKPTLSITHAEDTNNAIEILADAVTTATVINVSADALTTGTALSIDDDSANTGTRNTVEIIQNNASATGATALVVQADGNGALPGVKIDKNFTGTTSIGTYPGGPDPAGLEVDYDVTGIVASGQTAYHDALAINYNQDSPTMVGIINATGADIRMTGGTSGTQTMKGMAITLAGATNNTGIDITAPNDSAHIIARSSDSLLDYFKISVGESGATTVSTNDAGSSVGHLTLDADGKIILNALAGKEVVFNEDSENVDFRVESQNEQNAILVDAGSDVLHINKGKSAFSTKIWSNSDNAFEVNSSGVVINEEGHATNDFRAESDTSTHAIVVDSGNDQVLVHGSTTADDLGAGEDVVFFVSGSKADAVSPRRAAFGGNVIVSGSLASTGLVSCKAGVSGSYVESGLVKSTTGNLVHNSAADIILQTNGNNIFWIDSGTTILTYTNSSSDVIIQPAVANKKIELATTDTNTVAEVDSSADGFRINRKMWLGLDSIGEDATLDASNVMNVIAATSGNVTGTLADPVANGQLKIIMGVTSGANSAYVTYTGLSGSVTKTLTSGSGIILVSLNMGSLVWLLVGDVS